MKLPIHTGTGIASLGDPKKLPIGTITSVTAYIPNPQLNHAEMNKYLALNLNHLMSSMAKYFVLKVPKIVVWGNHHVFDHTMELMISINVPIRHSFVDKVLRRWYKLIGDQRHLCNPWCENIGLVNTYALAFHTYIDNECSKLNLEFTRSNPELSFKNSEGIHCPHYPDNTGQIKFQFDIADHTPFLITT